MGAQQVLLVNKLMLIPGGVGSGSEEMKLPRKG